LWIIPQDDYTVLTAPVEISDALPQHFLPID